MSASRPQFAGMHWLKQPADADTVSDTGAISATVKDVLAAVRAEGDAAVRRYAKQFDKNELQAFEVTAEERQAAVAALDPQTRKDTEFAIANVTAFAKAQLATMQPLDVEILPGVHMSHRIIPVERVGCYVPGGRYPLLSAPVMTIVPAKVAGVDEVIACLPPNAHQAIVAGCHLSGTDRIFRIGGAQAIAAMAFGTQTVPKVDKIVRPGNAFVNEAKRQAFGSVGIDQLARPSEI
jgi:sulfopropanediol 3-dehydrogenase